MPEQQPPSAPWYDPRVFASTPLGRLGASPRRGEDPAAVGPYAVLAVLGRGGMGRIYLGRPSSGAPGLATVKVIRPEYADDPQFRLRFRREATALQRVRGEYTAVFLGVSPDGSDGQPLWMAAEYIPGLSLSDAVAATGRLRAEAAWRLVGDLGGAVAAMERVGVVHRDLKPANVVLGPDGGRLIDFGIAYAAETSSITVTGQQVGTPAYMSPEQVRGQAVSSAADVFSLGSVIAYAVAGSAPFGAGTTVDVLHRVAFEPPKEEVLAEVAEADPGLAALVERCLEKDAGRRPSPEELIAEANLRRVGTPWSAELSSLILDRCQAAGEAERAPLPESTGTLRIGPAVGPDPGAPAAPHGVPGFGPPTAGTPGGQETPGTAAAPYGTPQSTAHDHTRGPGGGRTPTAPTDPLVGPRFGFPPPTASPQASSGDAGSAGPAGPDSGQGERPHRGRLLTVLGAAGTVLVAAAVAATVTLLVDNHGAGRPVAAAAGSASASAALSPGTVASASAARPSPSGGTSTRASAPASASAAAASAAAPTTAAAGARPPPAHRPPGRPPPARPRRRRRRPPRRPSRPGTGPAPTTRERRSPSRATPGRPSRRCSASWCTAGTASAPPGWTASSDRTRRPRSSGSRPTSGSRWTARSARRPGAICGPADPGQGFHPGSRPDRATARASGSAPALERATGSAKPPYCRYIAACSSTSRSTCSALASGSRYSTPIARPRSQPWRTSSIRFIPATASAGIVCPPRSISSSQTRGSLQAATALSSWTRYASAQSGSAVKSRFCHSSGTDRPLARASRLCEVHSTRWFVSVRTSYSAHGVGPDIWSGRTSSATRAASAAAVASSPTSGLMTSFIPPTLGAERADRLEETRQSTVSPPG